MSGRFGSMAFTLLCVLVGLVILGHIIRAFRAGGSPQGGSSRLQGADERTAATYAASGQGADYKTRGNSNRDDDGWANAAAHNLERPSEHARMDDAYTEFGGGGD